MATFPQGFKVALLASNEEVRDAAASVLTACSYKVTPAASVDDCLHLCTVQRIDIVLAESSDLTMEKEKTMQLMTSLKNLPLIVMSDSDTPSAVFHGLKIGAVDFLKRPLDVAKVRSMWQHTLQKRMVGVPSMAEEGGSQRRGHSSVPAEQPGTTTGLSRLVVGPALSEGSSNEKKETLQSTLESTPATDPPTELPPETAQSFASEPQQSMNVQLPSFAPPDTASASNIMGPTGSSHGVEQRRVRQKTGSEGQRRRIRPDLSNRETASSGSSSHLPQTVVSSVGLTAMPPLLGIPPGCVPPIGSNGQAIGMPFLNQHPFMPSNPMTMSSFGFVPPFMYGQGSEQEMMGDAAAGGRSFDAGVFASLPTRPQVPPSSGISVPPPVPLPLSPEPTRELQRVSSTPVTATPNDPPAADQPEEQPDVPQRTALRKSPSLVNF